MARPLPDPNLPWPIIREGVAEISVSEDLRLKAYRCWAGKWTCGWGETDGVTPTTVWTKEYADQRFCDSLTERTNQVLAVCTLQPTAHELAAMVSLQYNIGHASFSRSTVLRQHNAGNRQAAARAFGLWNKARNPSTGLLEVLSALTARRAREAALYLTPDDSERPEPMPQAVEGESSLARSPINTAGAATVGLGGLTAVTQLADQVQEASGALATVKGAAIQVADFVGVPPWGLLAIGLIVVGFLVMQQRSRQRQEGWA